MPVAVFLLSLVILAVFDISAGCRSENNFLDSGVPAVEDGASSRCRTFRFCHGGELKSGRFCLLAIGSVMGVLRRDLGGGCDELQGREVYSHMWLAHRQL